MCGRYTLTADPKVIEQRFQLSNIDTLEIEKRYNIAPTQNILAVINDGEVNKAGYMRWGLIPAWAASLSIGNKMINARSETLSEKPSFKQLLRRRRCIIIADGFFEWKKENGTKQPYRIKMKTEEPFAFAGLWDRNLKNGKEIISCTMITTKANPLIKEIHERMPVILTKENENIWLDRSIEDVDWLSGLLMPYDDKSMDYYKVSDEVNSPKLDDAICIKPK